MADRQRINAFIRRSARCGFASAELPPFEWNGTDIFPLTDISVTVIGKKKNDAVYRIVVIVKLYA